MSICGIGEGLTKGAVLPKSILPDAAQRPSVLYPPPEKSAPLAALVFVAQDRKAVKAMQIKGR